MEPGIRFRCASARSARAMGSSRFMLLRMPRPRRSYRPGDGWRPIDRVAQTQTEFRRAVQLPSEIRGTREYSLPWISGSALALVGLMSREMARVAAAVLIAAVVAGCGDTPTADVSFDDVEVFSTSDSGCNGSAENPNCYDAVTLYPNGRADKLFDDIIASGSYTIDGRRISIVISEVTQWSATFVLSSDGDALLHPETEQVVYRRE